MKMVKGGLFVPDAESDHIMIGSGIFYQSHKLNSALRHVKKHRTALDIGAHCGLWTQQLADHFDTVECFEPLKQHADLWEINVKSDGCTLYRCALGDREGDCGLHIVEDYPARSHINGGTGIVMRKLDSFNYHDVDLLKVDCEGYELFVLKGGEEMLKRCRPVVIVEQKPGFGKRYNIEDTSAVEYLKTLGAEVVDEITGDYIMVFK